MAKKAPKALSQPGVRFLVNREGTRKWDELDPESILEWVESEKDVSELTKDWLSAARHGAIYVVGVNRVVAVELN